MTDFIVTHHSDQQPSRDDDRETVIEIGSLRNQETAGEAAGSQNGPQRTCGEIITSRFNGRHAWTCSCR